MHHFKIVDHKQFFLSAASFLKEGGFSGRLALTRAELMMLSNFPMGSA